MAEESAKKHNKQMAEESEKKQMAEESAKKQMAEESAKKQIAEESAKKQMAEESAKKQMAEESAKKQIAEESEKKQMAEKSAKKQMAEESLKKRKKKMAEERAKKQIAEESEKKQMAEESAKKRKKQMAEESAKKQIAEESAKKHENQMPAELVELVLMRLPVKSLARFLLVSKSWADTISSPQFNVRRSKSQPQTAYIVKYPNLITTSLGIMRFDLKSNDFSIDETTYKLGADAFVRCSNNGILLLQESLSQEGIPIEMNLYLMNPTVGAASRLDILSLHRNMDKTVSYGHYYDSRADLKAVVMYIIPEDSELPGPVGLSYSVWSCRNKAWTEMIPLPPESRIYNGMFVNGYFYRWAPEERKLVSFNVRKGTFEESGGPEEVRKVDFTDAIYLCEVTGRLCLYCNDNERTRLRVWVMEKKGDEGCFGEWREMINMNENGNKVLEQSFLGEEDRVLCLTTDGVMRRSRYFVYDDETKRYEEKKYGDSWILQVVPHFETLLSPFHFYNR